jgi:hypothetical protein
MSVLPLDPWVIKTRKVILWVGLGWPVAAFFMAFGQTGGGIWAAIGATFLATVFVPPSLLFSLMLPTHKIRIVGVPLLLLGVYWWHSSQSYNYTKFSIHPIMLLWLTTFTAVALLVPQWSSVALFIYRLIKGR